MDVDDLGEGSSGAQPQERTPSKQARRAPKAAVLMDEFVDDSDDEGAGTSKKRAASLWRSKQERASWLRDARSAQTISAVAYCLHACAYALEPLL